jgi:cell division septation protein DedD
MADSPGTDDGFREIQLNGKQLVFLFMAATVVSVVIFLCGVLVGRGVQPVDLGEDQQVSDASSSSVVAEVAGGDAAASLPLAAITATGEASPPSADPPPTSDELSYFDRLENDGSPDENLRTPAVSASVPVEELLPPVPPPAAPPARREPPRAAPVPPPVSTVARAEPPPAGAASISGTDPDGAGYAVQVAALRARVDADTVAERLNGKGYPAYVMSPADGAPASVYRVRVGKFPTLQEANRVAARLEREEQVDKPWVIR